MLLYARMPSGRHKLAWNLVGDIFYVRKSKAHYIRKFKGYGFNQEIMNELPSDTKIVLINEVWVVYNTTVGDVVSYNKVEMMGWFDAQYIYPLDKFTIA